MLCIVIRLCVEYVLTVVDAMKGLVLLVLLDETSLYLTEYEK